MDALRFIFLVVCLSKCLGHTKFIYTTKNEVKLFCKTNKWQISTKSDNRIDVTCTVECVPGEQLELINNQNHCTKKVSDKGKNSEKCRLNAASGFYRCVTALDSGFLYPFKPSPNTVISYIVATANEEMTTESEKSSLVQLTEGEDVLLNCSFVFTRKEDSKEFTVYWIKTIEKISNCVYSYDYDYYNGIKFNQQRNGQEELLYRISHQIEGKDKHNIRISNLTGSDTGQYLCALQVNMENKTKGKWKIINNITLSVYSKGHGIIKNRTEDKESERAGINTDYIPLYVIIPILLALAIAAVVFIWKKAQTSPGSQVIELHRNQHGDDMEETADEECSPYAVGSGEDEIKFRSKMDDLKQEGLEESKDIYSVVKQNDLYEPGLI